MNLFYGQESLTIIQWVIRGVIAYLVLLIAAKFLGQRAISQLGLLDFTISIILGNILAHPLSDEGLGMTGSITTTIVLVTLYSLSLNLSLKSNKFQKFLSPPPIPVIRNGEIIYNNLSKAKISLDFLLSELRINKIDDIKKVAIALWEPGGNISIFLDTPYQALTPDDMQIKKSAFSLPVVVIKDGIIDINALHDINKTSDWLIDVLKTSYSSDVKSILLATIDINSKVQIYYK